MININKHRKLDYPIDPIYINRWSPRAFKDQDVPEEVLHSLFEAARWAPSAANRQPWRFIYARTDADREKFLTFINDGNVIWCKHAPVLVAVASLKKWKVGGRDINPTHAFDTGTAWGYLALEAARQGLIAHGMGGFDREKAQEVLQIPVDYEVHAMIAIGYQGEKEMLTESLQEREVPSNRKQIGDISFEGKFENN